KLVFSSQPTTTTSTNTISPSPAVAVHDAYDNTATTDTTSVTVAIGTNPGSGTLSGTKTIAASAGVATFGGLSIDKAGTGYTLTATDGSFTSATSSTFNINVGSATKLAFTTQPGGATAANTAFPAASQPVVAAQDAGGNTVTSYTTAVALTLTTKPNTATLSGCTSTTVSGVAAFSGCKISLTGNGYGITAASGALTSATTNTLTATRAGLTNGVSNAFTISAGPATQLVWWQQPASGAVAGAAFGTQPLVLIEDAYANVATTYTTPVSLAITAGTGTSGAT